MLGLTDYLKAFAVAIAIMVLNVIISYGVVAIYASLIEPGHDSQFYENAAQSIAPWSSVAVGPFLFFAAIYFFSRRRAERNAVGFGLAVVAIYAIIDIAIVASAGALSALAGILALSIATKALGAWLGAKAATR